MNIAIIGATGLVGREMIKVIEEFNFEFDKCFLAASQQSKGKKIKLKNTELEVKTIDEVLKEKVHIALFSAGSEISKIYAPLFAQNGTFVIDNSSQWRLYERVPLVVPEINSDEITINTKIISNPNCSTIQLVVVLNPLHKKFKIKRVVVSTYQSVTGSGMRAVNQLFAERENRKAENFYPHPIDLNCFPFAGSITDNGYTTEEMKLTNETKKILNDNSIQVTATVVRIPVIGGHSESVNIEFCNNYELSDIYQILQNTPGVIVMDDPKQNIYPTPKIVNGKNEVFVGRIRRDFSLPNALNLWIVADNLRKGAATNAVQIAMLLKEKFFK
ncbi:MAG: aspartate-semialdehyde dehydrogenase [Bacteroidales bacterium]|nr:aspartate-semialdehyde dehydrogenase [Bacteroidales bacterium]